MKTSTLLKRKLRYLKLIREYISAAEALSATLADQRNFNNLYHTIGNQDLTWHAVIQCIGNCSGIPSEQEYLGLLWLELTTKYGLDGKPTEDNLTIIEISILAALEIAKRNERDLANLLTKATTALFGPMAMSEKDWQKFRARLIGTSDICFCDISDGRYREGQALRNFALKKLQGQEFKELPISPTELLAAATAITDIPVPQI